MKEERTVEVNITSLCGTPESVAEDLRMLAAKVERSERFETTASACVVSVGLPGQWAQASATDADVAREFFRRFGPIRVLLGKHGERVVYAEGDDDGGDWLSGMSFGDTQNVAHGAGEDGFTAALERARQLVRGGR